MGGPRGGRPRALASLPRRELGMLGTCRLGVGCPRSVGVFSDVTATEGAVVEGPESRDKRARKALAVGLGAVLLRLRLWYLLITGGMAASFIGSYCSRDGGLAWPDVVGIPSVVNDRNCGLALEPLAIRIESRIGLRCIDPPKEAAGLISCAEAGSSGGIGGRGVRSFMLIGE